MKKHTLAWFALMVTTLAGCGQTGPLYLPKDEPKPTNTGTISIKGSDGSVTTTPATSDEKSKTETQQSQPTESAQ